MCELHWLQMLINTAARVVSVRSRFDHITDFVKDVLHWLPITKRVHFKVCTLVYKATQGLAPTYLSDLVVKSIVSPQRCDLRSSAHSRLIPAPHRRQFAERTFAVGGPIVWNSLLMQFTMRHPNNISSSIKGTFVYHRVWKQLIIMVITSEWTVIIKRRGRLVVLLGAI